MYARTDYPPTSEELNIPQNYGGVALVSDDAAKEPADDTAQACSANETPSEIPCGKKNPWEYHEPPCNDTYKRDDKQPSKGAFSFAGILGKLPFLGSLGELPLLRRLTDKSPGGATRLFDDTEDLLLIALAVFLFFSSDGDKLCALILLGLVFLT